MTVKPKVGCPKCGKKTDGALYVLGGVRVCTGCRDTLKKKGFRLRRVR